MIFCETNVFTGMFTSLGGVELFQVFFSGVKSFTSNGR